MDAQQENQAIGRSPARRKPWQSRLVVLWMVLMLAIHAVLGLDCGRRLTVTLDEYLHMPVGFLNWKTGRFDFDTGTPPLVRMWSAFPLLFTSATFAGTDLPRDGWATGDAFLEQNQRRYQELFAYSRGMIVLFSVLAGVVLFIWSRELFGDAAACLTVLLWAFSPTILANAALVTADLGATAFFVLTVYALWKFAQTPSWRRACLFGLCMGLAQLAKYTSLLLGPLCVVLWFFLRTRNPAVQAASAKRVLLQWFTCIVLTLAIVNAGYLFHGSFSPLGSYNFGSRTLSAMQEKLTWLHWFPVPLPREYVQGIDTQRAVMEGQHPVFLDGAWSTEGFRSYYLMALWYKLPHVLQLTIVLAALFLCRPGRKSPMWRTQMFLLAPPFLLVTLANMMRMQLGMRHVLSAIPFLILFGGQTGRWIDWRRYRWRTAVVTLLAAGTFFSVRYHPHHLAYFNELAGGPRGGYLHLVDSNIDWGQDLGELKQYLDTHGISEIGLAYFGMVPPESLGIRYHLPPSQMLQPGWYAVSVSVVQGRPFNMRAGGGELRPVGIDEFGYFRFFEPPTARIGYSIHVYHVTELDVMRFHAAVRRFSR